MTKIWHHWVTDRFCRSQVTAAAVTTCCTVVIRSSQLHHSHITVIIVNNALAKRVFLLLLRIKTFPYSNSSCRPVTLTFTITLNSVTITVQFPSWQVVKVVWHKAASPPDTNRSVVFARWRRHALVSREFAIHKRHFYGLSRLTR